MRTHALHRSRIFRFTSILAVGLIALRSPAAETAPDPAHLTLDRIFTANEFKEKTVETVRWSKLAPVYFTLAVRDEKAKEKQRDLVRNDAATGEKSVLVPAEALVPAGEKKPLTVDSFEFSKDERKLLLFTNTKKVWRKNTRGDYWVMDVATRELRKLGGDAAASTLMFAKFSPDGSRVAFVRAGNLYVQDLSTMQIAKLTTDGSVTRFNGTSDWVNEEELGIRDGFRWSPDGTRIVFWQFDAEGVKKFWLVNNTETAYQRFTTFPYPKVGEKNSAVRLGVVKASGGAVRWLEIPGDPREHYIPHVEWTEDGKQLLLQQFNRLQNTNLVLRADPGAGETSVVLTETDAAWVENKNTFRWADDSLVWLSERSGWRHAYLASVDGQRCEPITTGQFDVIDLASVDAKAGWLYYLASPDNPTQRYLCRTRLQGGVPERLSPATQPGWHSYDISPDAQWAVHTYSTFTTPPVVELVQLPEHKVVRVLEDNRKVRDKLAALTQPACEFLRVEVGGGVSLDGWCIRPPALDANAKHPLLMHVYGEPASQTVKDSWGGQRTLWHWMLAQQGYVIASVDNRGTPSPRGREWRKCVYRQVGILAAQEQADAVRALVQRWPFTNAARVGVWGWSGGGSMSLNAIFRHPDLYRTAMAIAPVADRRLYNSIYEERYMGSPRDNAEGYRLASPITHAAALKGNLLIVHGTGDDNVHYQATEKLMNELIAKNKKFTAMAYPNRSHSVSEGKGTSRHLYELLTNYLREHLPTKP